MPPGLILDFRPDDEAGLGGFLKAQASDGSFSGAAEAWVKTDTVLQFAEALSHYPLPADPPTRLLGSWPVDLSYACPTISLSVVPVGSAGRILATIKLCENGSDADDGSSLRIVLSVEYESLRRFALALKAMIGGTGGAELTGV